MKKKISLYMALIMFINVFIPMASPAYTAQAASGLLNLECTFSQILTLSSLSPAPELVSKKVQKDGQACFYWSLQEPANKPNDLGMYVLRYYKDDGTKAELIVELAGASRDTLHVNYDVYEQNTSAGGLFVNINDPVHSPYKDKFNNKTDELGYQVHAPRDKRYDEYTPIQNFFTPDNFNDGTENDPNTNAILRKTRVNNRDPYNPGSINDDITALMSTTNGWINRLSPSFSITAGYGYSFTYNGLSVNFLWDSRTNRFYFSTNGIEDGYIYDFKLEYYTQAQKASYDPKGSINSNTSGYFESDIHYVCTGINKNSFSITPTANYPNSADAAQNADPSLPYIYDNTFPNYLLRETGYVAYPHYNDDAIKVPETFVDEIGETKNISTALPSNGLDIRFDLFKTYDETTQEYKYQPPADPNAAPPLPISVELRHPVSEYGVGLEIGNVYLLEPYADNNPHGEDSNVKLILPPKSEVSLTDVSLLQRTGAAQSDRIRIRLDNLDAGVIYSALNIYIHDIPGVKISTLSTSMADDVKLHTFIKYDLDPKSGYISVDPYTIDMEGKDPSGYYRLMTGPSSGNLTETQLLRYTGTKPIPFRIVPNTLARMLYRVDYSVSGSFTDDSTYYSQIIEYEYKPPAPSVGVPDQFTLSNVKLTPTKESPEGLEGNLSFRARWDVGDMDMIRALYAEAVKEADDNGVTVSDGDRMMSIEYSLHTSSAPSAVSANYSPFDTVVLNLFTSDSALWVSYDGIAGDNPKITTLPQPLPYRTTNNTSGSGTYYADVTFSVKAAHVSESAVTPPPDFWYPNVYFMKVEPVKMTRPRLTDTTLSDISTSRFASMTLDDISRRPTVPTPVNVILARGEIQPTLDITFDIPGDAVKKYLDSMYPYQNRIITVNLYIGSFENRIKDSFYDNYEKPENGVEDLRIRREVLSDEYFTTSGSAIDLSGYLPVLRGKNTANTDNSGVVCIAGIPLQQSNGAPETNGSVSRDVANGITRTMALSLIGLDENQEYYVFADLVITQWDDINSPAKAAGDTKIDLSAFSSIKGETTGVTTQPIPDPSEKVPSSPNVWPDKENVGQTSATIFWDRINFDPGEANAGDVEIEYDIVRVKDLQLDTDLLSGRDVDLSVFLKDINVDAMGWRTDGSNYEWYERTGSGAVQKTTVNNPDAYRDKFEYKPDKDPISFTDYTLMPNQLYFYYVRTLRTTTVYDEINGRWITKTLVSSWSAVSVTTTPVQAPTRLRLEPNYAEFDRKKEIIVSFDSLPVADLGTNNQFKFYIKADNGDWELLDDKQLTLLESYPVTTDNGDFTHFIYKITGLKAGTLYTLRVRLYDVLADDYSLYSNSVEFKTVIDQDEYDDLIKTDDWMNFLEKELQKLLRDPYWLARDSSTELSVVYRPGDMFNGLLHATPDSAMTLYGNNADSAVYYIPVSALITANDAGKGFKITYNDLEIQLPPKMLDMNYNDAVLAMADQIKARTVSDYFVKVSVTRSRAYGMVENDPTLGKQTRISVELAGVDPSVTDIKTWDADLYTQFAALLDAKINDPKIREDLLKQIKNKTVSEEMVKYVAELVSDIKSELLSIVYSALSTRGSGILSDYSKEVSSFNAGMMLIARGLNDNAYVNAYQLQNGSWIPRDVMDFYNGKGISAAAPGTFVFTGRTVNIPGIENVQEGGAISSFTAKYGLDDYLGREAVNLGQTATRYMVAGCVARMSGAPKTADPIVWISTNLNVTLSSRNAVGSVQTQEAAAMVMALYEKKTGTKIASMTIRNYAATAGMTGLDDRYTQAVRAAFETGILSDTNLRPSGVITIGKLLDMLAALDKKVKL